MTQHRAPHGIGAGGMAVSSVSWSSYAGFYHAPLGGAQPQKRAIMGAISVGFSLPMSALLDWLAWRNACVDGARGSPPKTPPGACLDRPCAPVHRPSGAELWKGLVHNQASRLCVIPNKSNICGGSNPDPDFWPISKYPWVMASLAGPDASKSARVSHQDRPRLRGGTQLGRDQREKEQPGSRAPGS